jgi:hypothetical protein
MIEIHERIFRPEARPQLFPGYDLSWTLQQGEQDL